jgi:hypothetical protein
MADHAEREAMLIPDSGPEKAPAPSRQPAVGGEGGALARNSTESARIDEA